MHICTNYQTKTRSLNAKYGQSFTYLLKLVHCETASGHAILQCLLDSFILLFDFFLILLPATVNYVKEDDSL